MRLDAAAVRDYGAEIVVVRYGRALGRRRAQLDHARADPGRRRLASTRADARAADARREAPARQPRARLRLRGLLRGAGRGREARARGHSGRARHPLSSMIAPVLRRDARGPAAAPAPPRRRASASTARRPSSGSAGAACARRTSSASRSSSRSDAVVLVTQRLSKRRALSRARCRPGRARRGGDRGRLPDRRLRRAADHRRRDLRRAPPRRARSTRRTPRSRCRTCASGWCSSLVASRTGRAALTIRVRRAG